MSADDRQLAAARDTGLAMLAALVRKTAYLADTALTAAIKPAPPSEQPCVHHEPLHSFCGQAPHFHFSNH